MPISPGPWIAEGRRVYSAPHPRSTHPNGRILLFQFASENHGVDSPWGASPEEARSIAKQGIDDTVAADIAVATAAPELAQRLHKLAQDRHYERDHDDTFTHCGTCAQDVALLKRAGAI